ncbi:MAG: alanine--tRNA ligase [Proteobacteria bacterium]|nr:alanine--tRNA ligase [Pseudomonadota bacterium]
MKAQEIREAFLAYFEKNGHTRVKSSSLVPQNDPTIFFTNAGMVQFKETFVGDEKRPYTRACSSQKCMRVSGKHNDLENVGHTPRHHTFFEMLGNFSFGDYFKQEAIAYAWEFLTEKLGLDPERMYATVFKDDDEAERLWEAHLPKGRIFRLGEKDNFWAMGDTGPCGPCSEIIWDFGEGPVKAEDLDSDRFMEIWNLVFMQFNRSEGGELVKLEAPSIDTGMGLERLAAVVEGVKSNWETDLFRPLIAEAARATAVKAGSKKDVDVALRVIADHLRCSAFLIGDGVIPSNEGRGYVLRRILRRAIRYGKRIGRDEPFLSGMVGVVVEEMGAAYPDLATHEHFITKVIGAEEERFFATLDKGLDLLMAAAKTAKDRTISGETAFRLYDTFGFPLDVTGLIAAEQGLSVDTQGFEKLMEEQRMRARASWRGSGEESVGPAYKEMVSQGIRCGFEGYGKDTTESQVIAILRGGARVEAAKEGDEIEFVAASTPFYGESGGQVGDTGVAVAEGIEIQVEDTKRPLPDLIVHRGKVMRGELSVGARLTLAIDAERRDRIRANHTSTHLLHRSLREVLGEHVKQAGSLVGPDRFRFDFSHFQAMTAEEQREVERRVNAAIRKNYPVLTYELTYDEAVSRGALAFFGEKYGERVRMIDVSGFSQELCGGTHVHATGDIGMFRILSESSVAAGIRRIEGITGAGVEEYIDDLVAQRLSLAKALRTQPGELLDRAEKMAKEISALEKELKIARAGGAKGGIDALLGQARDVGGMKLLAAQVDAPDRDTLSRWAEKCRDRLGKSVVVLASVSDGKVSMIAAVSKDLTPGVHAGKIVGKVSEMVGGKGGGRPDFAQGGGADAANLDKALAAVEGLLK